LGYILGDFFTSSSGHPAAHKLSWKKRSWLDALFFNAEIEKT
jgi:hypothetical protein